MSLFLRFIFWLVIAVSAEASASQNVAIEAISLQRQSLSNLLGYVDATPHLFNRAQADGPILNPNEKAQILTVWRLFLDYVSTLDAVAEQFANYHAFTGQQRADRALIYHAALTAQYRYSLEFIQKVNGDAEVVKWLNHKHDGLTKKHYLRFRDQTLSDWNTDRYDQLPSVGVNGFENVLTRGLLEDRNVIANLSRFELMAANSARLLGRSFYNSYFPFQKQLARGVGQVKVWRFGHTLITPTQALTASQAMAPGDFFVTRREWRLTNVGIPGYWTHSALYIGSQEERDHYFNVPEVNTWLEKNGVKTLTELLAKTSELFQQHSQQDALGDIRVIEALEPGVILTSIESALSADGAAVLRPRLTKLAKAKALVEAVKYLGQPYDFEFDFETELALVCSELIVKAYQPTPNKRGIVFDIPDFGRGKLLTPNQMVKGYEDSLDTANQMLDFVLFIDGDERAKKAFFADHDAFIGTYKRPDWHVFKRSPS